MKYVADDSTTFWAIGHDSGVIAKHIEVCGEEVEMVIPFEGVNSGEVKHYRNSMCNLSQYSQLLCLMHFFYLFLPSFPAELFFVFVFVCNNE